MYKGVSGAAIGRVLPYQLERGNIHDPYAVTVVERGVIVGQKIFVDKSFANSRNL